MSLLEAVLVGLLTVALVALAWMQRARGRATRANAELKDMLAARVAFLATTAHEIRTPLNGILGMTQLLLANWRIDGDVRDQVKVMHGAGEAMLTLVDDILDAAKMAHGEVATVREEVALRVLLEDAARLWVARAEGKGVTLDIDIGDAPDMIESDGARLRQIIGNLLSNAIKFTSRGSVSLRAAVEGDTILVAVRDSGVGIPRDHLSKIFEAFHQVGGADARRTGGTGLGLPISLSLAEALGGTIDVRSVVGEGSVFTLRLPFEPVEPRAFRPLPTGLAQVRLLLVEGNPMTQGIFRGLIEPAVERFDCVADAMGAITVLRGGWTDHVLADARSAGIEGLSELIEVARERCVPVTVLVAPGDGVPLDEIEALEPTQLVVKPVAGAKLVAMLREAWMVEAAA